MPDFTGLLVLAAFVFIGFFSRQLKKQANAGNEDRGRTVPQQEKPVVVEMHPRKELEQKQQAYKDTARNMSHGKEEPDLDVRENDHPYEREIERPYQRQEEIPYHREELKPYQAAQKKKKRPFTHITKRQLAEGMILAEILNENPRAKRPHQAVKRIGQRPKG